MDVVQITRLPNWEERLSLYLDTRADMPFAWGTHDCALFAAGAVNAMCGIDPAADLRGTYDNATGAAQALRDHGAGTLIRFCTEWFGAHKHPAQAHRGDLVMRDRNTLGVCVGRYSWFVGQDADQREGLIHIPTAACTKAFSVPFFAGAGE